jgi:hypothetical protein
MPNIICSFMAYSRRRSCIISLLQPPASRRGSHRPKDCAVRAATRSRRRARSQLSPDITAVSAGGTSQ